MMELQDVIVILCRPSEPGNVGAVCRVMMNMGLSRLRIVCGGPGDRGNPAFAEGRPPPGSPLDTQVRRRAVHAASIWDGAAFFPTLKEAAADCSFAAGTTRRRGRKRKNVTADPRQLAEWLRGRSGAAAIVFGNEKFGLDDDELALCTVASHIPAADAFPSLNLSHAVQVYAWELFYALELAPPPKGAWTPLNLEQAEAVSRAVGGALEKLGFYKHPGRAEQERFLRDLVLRAGLSEREAAYFKDIVVKAGRLGS